MSKHPVASIAVLTMIALACGGAAVTNNGSTPTTPATVAPAPGDSGRAGEEKAAVTEGPQPAVSTLPDGPSALDDMLHPDFPDPLVDPGAILSGGPPPDGIPPIDGPQFIPIAENLDLLADNEPVVALDIDGDARAYPVSIMIWHEIVNDVVGGVPVAVTYCPLCNSAVAYERTINGFETTFGTSGRLFASALVMYDRATESLWTHYDGKAVVGVLTGHELEPIGSPLMAWSEFRAAYPDGLVLDPDNTGHRRAYGSNPYVGYDSENATPFLFVGDADTRAKAMQRVVGVTIGDDASAYALQGISGGAARATNSTVGASPVVIFWKAGQSSALEGSGIAGGRDVGSVGVFNPVIGGDFLTFTADGDVFVDEQTGSTWTVTGEATSGELTGTKLDRIPHLDSFWFAWSTYRPGTVLIEG